MNNAPSSLDLHDVIQLSDHIVLAQVTDVCEEGLSANVLKSLKGQSKEVIDVTFNATEVNIDRHYATDDSFIFFMEASTQEEMGLLFSMKKFSDDNIDQSYVLIETDQSYTIKLMPFIHAVESFIYNELEISLDQLN